MKIRNASYLLYRLILVMNIICPSNQVHAQSKKAPPIIDMHLHALLANSQGPAPLKIGAPFTDWGSTDANMSYEKTIMRVLKTGEWSTNTLTSPTTDDSLQMLTLKELDKYNVFGVTSGSDYDNIGIVRKWKKASPKRIINSIGWGISDIINQKLTLDSLRKLFKSGEFKVFGEIYIQYEGFTLSDSIMEPYLAMAEELNIPVGVHVGTGPPGIIYAGAKGYRARNHSALTLEEALIRHPKLRVYAMHAGWPLLDDVLVMLYAHPQLYLDLGIISYALPLKEYYFYIERLVNAGFGKRIMFGSDNMVWPQTIGIGIKNIENASFLTADQKRDILFNNAARFLQLSSEEIKAMQ